jgi:hypothetical protein
VSHKHLLLIALKGLIQGSAWPVLCSPCPRLPFVWGVPFILILDTVTNVSVICRTLHVTCPTITVETPPLLTQSIVDTATLRHLHSFGLRHDWARRVHTSSMRSNTSLQCLSRPLTSEPWVCRRPAHVHGHIPFKIPRLGSRYSAPLSA